jgi:hypothetical protein
MWKMALGVVVLLNAGGSPRAEATGPAAEPPAAANPAPRDEERPGEEQAPPAEAAPAPAPVEAPRSARANLRFRNDVGDKFTLVDVRFVMDGEALPTVLRGVERGKSAVVFAGVARPGRHIVTAHLTYQGRSRGIFTYPRGYTFKVTSDQVLTMPSDRAVTFTIVGSEVRGLKAPIDRRLAVTVEESTDTSAR